MSDSGKSGHGLKLGVILCKWCHRVIDEMDTEKVVVYYLECDREDCAKDRDSRLEVG
ncbi:MULTISPECIES: GapA-binding peptide SR1P [unclassified Paenibacillus]|uniref:GapA-binding peptide SR1P n=1 Tax=unclassified Paenibacillus TaxID=185978 RepID=UPI001C124AE5|nr:MULTISPECIES: GapA-binding peptide SR1P [unclassified Paenibacillus]MBU5440859.1 GapA-binding peptide SR1P [Paenibacillus sp. MSJ-34]CAH0118442.1 hypothetical protein PAE9249_00930 [Paenibacillus sp. CECT 9249]